MGRFLKNLGLVAAVVASLAVGALLVAVAANHNGGWWMLLPIGWFCVFLAFWLTLAQEM